jgi:hypothetical protein
VDDVAHVSFRFPGRVAPELGSKPVRGARPAPVRTYSTDVGDVRLTVALLVIGANTTTADPVDTFRQLVGALHDGGASDARLTRVTRLRVHGRPAADGTVTFTSTDGATSYWRLRAVRTAGALVTMQAQVFASPGDATAPSRVDALFTTLASGLAP